MEMPPLLVPGQDLAEGVVGVREVEGPPQRELG